MGDDEVDWSDVLPEAIVPATQVEPNVATHECVLLRSRGQQDVDRLRRRRAQFLPDGFPRPGMRTREQHAIVASRMRERRALLRAAKARVSL